MSIKVSEITKLYGKQKALDNISLEVNHGEIVGLLGPNGAGKSTLMKILSCYIPSSSGKAEISGFDCNNQSIEVRKKIGYLPESNPLYHDMYVTEYLKFVGGMYKVKNLKSRIDYVIEITGLAKEKHKKIGALSKGYKQRVGIAQAFIHDPEVLILDEPTSGLDPNQLVEIRNLIREIGKSKTVLFSSHIMQEVEAVCDRVIIINNGKLIADSPTRDLQQLWKGREIITVQFKEDISISSLNEIKNIEKVEAIDSKTYKISAPKEGNIREKLYDFSKTNQLTLIELKSEEVKLEDIFQKLTKNQ